MNRVRMLIYFGVTPYLVFDGDNLPSKAGTESDRAKRREESKRRGLELYRAGKIPQAHQELQKAVDVTPYMARQLIEELKRLNIQYVVAPYEADAQLAYLERRGVINGVLSEDSDLLVFGVKRLLTKLDQHGDCVEINRADFASCRDISLIGWTDAEFRRMAILSGCDYLPNISKMGLKTAYRYVRKYRNAEKVLRMLQLEGQFCVPTDYLENFYQAELTFLHHRVFCPVAKKLVFLTELEPGTKEEDLPFIGEDVDAETAIGVACGDLDPNSKRPIQVRATPSSSKSALVAPRRQTFPAVENLKATKSLDSFFKPRRQPLAELDPNSLTPSPSQQRLLQVHANASWEARPTSSAPQLRSSTSLIEDTNILSSRTTNRASFLARAATMSTYQPPKRQRLCSDAEEIATATGTSKSRFFNSNVEESSPSVRKAGKIKKARRSDFGIFSDDSVDDILLGLPDDPVRYPQLDNLANELTTDAAEPPPSSVDHDCDYFDDTQAVPETSPIGPTPDDWEPCASEQTITMSTKTLSQSSISQGSLTTAVSPDEDPEAFVNLLEYHVRKQNEVLQKTFIGQSPSQRADALRTLSQHSLHASTSVEGGNADETLSTELPREPSAASIVPVEGTSPGLHETLKKTFAYQPSSQQASALRSLSTSQNSKEKVTIGAAALTRKSTSEPLRRPLTPLQRLGQQALQKTEPVVQVTNRQSIPPPTNPATLLAGPSEDLTVPNSEDESGSDAEEPGTLQRHLNLAQFSFTQK